MSFTAIKGIGIGVGLAILINIVPLIMAFLPPDKRREFTAVEAPKTASPLTVQDGPRVDYYNAQSFTVTDGATGRRYLIVLGAGGKSVAISPLDSIAPEAK
jgi:hypothetical protein